MPDQWTSVLISSGIAFGVAIAIGLILPAVARRAMRRRPSAAETIAKARVPFRILLLVAATNIAFAANRPRGEVSQWWDYGAHALRIVAIINAAWLIGVVVVFLIDSAVRRADREMSLRDAKRVQTQVQVLRRIIVALIATFAVAAALLTFPGVRAVGASLFASAGLVSVVAALAAQSTLGNLFAGLQLAFSDAVRIDDVVIVEGEYGTVEEITLSYVVVKIWDDRRLILPCTYFTATPFQNWTRRDTEMMGVVEFDLDWRVDVTAMRAQLQRVLVASEYYNGRSSGLVVTGSTDGFVRVRAHFTAEDPGQLWDLQCLVREEMIGWLQTDNPAGLPHTRVEVRELDHA